jgi:hypothetical protein
MSTLDDKLREILRTPHQNSTGATVMEFPTTKLLTQIKQAFTDAGYVPTDIKEKADHLLQDMVNLHARMTFDMLRLGLTPTPAAHVADFSNGELSGLLTGQEWYDLMMDVIHDQPDSFQEAPDGKEVVLCYPLAAVERAAKRAAGIEK